MARRVTLSPALRSRFRLARSLLVTPWFAAGAGIVIAAALAVNTPTALTYGPTGPGGLCVTHSCTGERRAQPPQVATATPGVAIKAPDADAKGAGGPAPSPHGVTEMSDELGFQIVRDRGSGFTAVITMRGGAKTGWSLQFAFPAAHVRRVRALSGAPPAAATAARRTGVRHAGASHRRAATQGSPGLRRSPARRIPTR